MRTWRTMLLASAAALALTTGSGFAQGTQDHGSGTGAAQEHGGAAQPGSAMKPSGGATTNATSPAGKPEQKAQGTQPGGATMQKGAQGTQPGINRNAEENRGANPQNAQNKSDKDTERNAQKSEPNKNQAQQKPSGATTTNQAEQQKPSGTMQGQQPSNRSAEEQLGRNNRLQGNASGTTVQLNDQQRKEIRTTVIEKSGAPRVGHVDFDVAIGTAVPRERIHVIPVPETLVRIEPRWRGFMYFVYEDEIVVVDPHDYKIVAVLPV